DMQTTIDTMQKMQNVTMQMAATTHSMVGKIKTTAVDVQELRDHIADFDDFFRPIRNYLYWEPHCYDILDGVDPLTDDIQSLLPDLEKLDTLMPQLVALMPAQIETMKSMQQITR